MTMTIATLLGSRLATSFGALALAGSLAGGTAVAAKGPANDNPVQELRHELRDSTKADRAEIKQLREQLAAEYAKQNPDDAKMEQLHEAIEAKRASISDKRFEALVAMHDELDAQQRARLAEKLAGKGDRHAKGKAKAKDKAKADKPKRDRGEAGKAKSKAERGEAGKAKSKSKAERGEAGKAKAKAKADNGKDRRPV